MAFSTDFRPNAGGAPQPAPVRILTLAPLVGLPEFIPMAMYDGLPLMPPYAAGLALSRIAQAGCFSGNLYKYRSFLIVESCDV
jgi:hypothetical protein